MTEATATNTPTPLSSSALLRRLRSLTSILLVIAVSAALLVVVSGRWSAWIADSRLQTTDDAQVRADLTPLSTKSSGIVARVAVNDFERVRAGDLLVQLKDDDFQAQVELAEAAVMAAEAAIANLKSQRKLQSSRIAVAAANVQASAPDVERTQRELEREQNLEGARVSTRQHLEAATADFERQAAALTSRKAELEAQRRQFGVLDTQELQLQADLAAKRAALKVARVNLEYTRIVAPEDGIVGERKVRPGQLVSAGTQVLALVGTRTWVVANYKEVQLARVRVGDPATVRIDGIPGREWSGHVATIAPGSGSIFSLLPPDNATGNFTKIAQRIPVKVLIDTKDLDARLRPGMSATVSVRTAP